MNAKELEEKTLKIISKNVLNKRSELGLSQGKLANKMGVFRPYIVLIEKGSKGMTLSTLSKLALALDTTISDLVTE